MNHLPIAEHDLEKIWHDIQAAFARAGEVAPAAGFVDRFRVRLAAQQAAQARRQALLVAALWLGLALLMGVALLWLLWPLFANPLTLFFDLLAVLAGWFSQLVTLFSVFASLLQFLPDVLPSGAFSGLLALLAAVAAWGFSGLREFALARGVRL